MKIIAALLVVVAKIFGAKWDVLYFVGAELSWFFYRVDYFFIEQHS